MPQVVFVSEIESAKQAYYEGRYEEGLQKLKYFWDYEKPETKPNPENLSSCEYAGLLLTLGVLYGAFGFYKIPQNSEAIARDFLFQAYEIFCGLEMDEQILYSITFLAISFRRAGETEEARKWIADGTAIDIPDGHPAKLRLRLTEFLIDIAEGRYKETLGKLRSLRLYFEKLGNDCYSGMYQSQIGTCRKKLNKDCLFAYRAARDYYAKAGHKYFLLFAENNLAYYFISVNDTEKANYHAECALEIAKEFDEKYLIGYLYDTKALIALVAKRFEEALMFADLAVSELRQTICYAQLVEFLGTKKQILTAKGDYASAGGVEDEIEKILLEHPGTEKTAGRFTPDVALLKFSEPPQETIRIEKVKSDRHAHIGLEKGYFVIIENVPVKDGDFVAVFIKTVKWCNFGFYSSCEGLLDLESRGESEPHIFGNGDIEILGKVVGFCTPQPDGEGKFLVMPLQI